MKNLPPLVGSYKVITGTKINLTWYENLDLKAFFFALNFFFLYIFFFIANLFFIMLHVTQFVAWCYHLCVIFHKVLHTYVTQFMALCYHLCYFPQGVTYICNTVYGLVLPSMCYFPQNVTCVTCYNTSCCNKILQHENLKYYSIGQFNWLIIAYI